MKKTFAIASVLALISGCVETTPVPTKPVKLSANQIASAQSKVTHNFKDPSSAQFRGLSAFGVQNGDSVVCGEVNGKNSFGAFVGFKPFYIRMNGDQVKRLHIDDQDSIPFAKSGCNQARAGTLDIATSELTVAQ